MLIERLLLTIFIILISLAIFMVYRYLHLRRLRTVALAPGPARGRPMVLYFRSDSCAPCQTQAPYLRDLEETYGSRLSVQMIDADINKDMASRFGVITLPTTLILDRSGEVKHINYGLTTTSKLSQQMEKII